MNEINDSISLVCFNFFDSKIKNYATVDKKEVSRVTTALVYGLTRNSLQTYKVMRELGLYKDEDIINIVDDMSLFIKDAFNDESRNV